MNRDDRIQSMVAFLPGLRSGMIPGQSHHLGLYPWSEHTPEYAASVVREVLGRHRVIDISLFGIGHVQTAESLAGQAEEEIIWRVEPGFGLKRLHHELLERLGTDKIVDNTAKFGSEYRPYFTIEPGKSVYCGESDVAVNSLSIVTRHSDSGLWRVQDTVRFGKGHLKGDLDMNNQAFYV